MPLQAGHPEHLAVVQVEIDAGETRAGSKIACPQRNVRGRGRHPLGVEALHLPPEHLGDDFIVAHFANRMARDGLAIAEHGDPVGNLSHLGQPMRDEDHQQSRSG